MLVCLVFNVSVTHVAVGGAGPEHLTDTIWAPVCIQRHPISCLTSAKACNVLLCTIYSWSLYANITLLFVANKILLLSLSCYGSEGESNLKFKDEIMRPTTCQCLQLNA